MAQQGFQATAAVPGLEAAQVAADKGIRVAGYLIDVLPAIVLGLFALIPIMGPIMAGLLLTPYWLLRDITGSSLGKLILRTMVVRKDGQPAVPGRGPAVADLGRGPHLRARWASRHSGRLPARALALGGAQHPL